MRRLVAALVLGITSVSAAAAHAVVVGGGGTGGIARVAEPIASHYVVSLRVRAASVATTALDLSRAYGGRIGYVYGAALNGFSVEMRERAALALSRDPRVALVEEDGVVRAVTTQTNPTWGLDRIDQRDRPLSGTYSYSANGSGVKAYIIDTGIRFSHAQFGGRATSGYDFVSNDADASDCNGHGTHVAGTVGGTTYGVAKAVSLVGVRVLDCTGTGSTSGVIAGVNWVTNNHQAGQNAVANMSLGGGASSSLDTAVRNSIADGVTYGVAAGNGNILGMAEDACGTSPARVAEALTVGATDSADKKASWSNYGTCLDIFAPGVGVTSAWYTSDTATNTISGTSMATPHVVGVAAMYLSANSGKTPAQVASALTGNATLNHVTSPGSGSSNRLLYMGFIGGAPSNVPPVASFTSSCSGLTCSFTDTSSDSDGTVASRSWNFGDGSTSTATNPSHTYAAGGTYTVTLTVTDNGGATGSKSSTVTVSSGGDPDPATPNLSNGVTKTDTNAAAGGWKYYKILVPSGKTKLKVDLTGPACGLLTCNPDLDLFVRRAAKPTTSTFNCSSESPTSTESCTLTNPAGDWYYIGVYTYSGSSGKTFTIKATFS